MLRQILVMILEQLDNNQKKVSTIDSKIVQLVDEIDKLEVLYAQALADVERWGNIDDKSDWRTVEYNRIGRVIDAKIRMMKALKQNV